MSIVPVGRPRAGLRRLFEEHRPLLASGPRWRLVALELAITLAVLTVYFLLRGQRPDDIEASVDRSLMIIRFEREWGLFHEAQWQQAFLDYHWLMDIANFVYAWMHYPVMFAVGIWLLVKDPVRFRFIRNVLLVSATIGLLTYWFWPAAPPRLMAEHGYDFGFIDTVHGATSNVNYFQPSPFVNDYAALPSFHFGWIALVSAAIWVNTRRASIRLTAVAMSVVMWWAIVVTGNHYFFDMLMGGAVVGFAWTLVW
ncbi:MAG: phosphatase PAP2 family protein, partial [Dehalococcoidia bacterium]